MPLFSFLSPSLFQPDALRGEGGGVAIVIDQLRASTTIAHALAAGADAIIPCEEIDEARAAAAQLPGSLLGGERRGVKVPGFDLGNSPAEFTPDRIAGKTIVFTTTNGTRALRRAKSADRILIGCLANRSAVARAAAELSRPIFLICAGIHDQVSAEDVYAAGAIAESLLSLGITTDDDSTSLALAAWQPLADDPTSLLRAMHNSRGGRNLASVNLSSDVELCSRVDVLTVVPTVNPHGQIVASPGA